MTTTSLETLRKIEASLKDAYTREMNKGRSYRADQVSLFLEMAGAVKVLADREDFTGMNIDLSLRQLSALGDFVRITRKKAKNAADFGQAEVYLRLTNDADVVFQSIPHLTPSEQEIMDETVNRA